MALVPKRVLIITQDVGFSVSIIQALEQTGDYLVSSFTSAQNAIVFLQQSVQDVALVDFNLPDMPGPDLVLRLQTIRPEMGILIGPDDEDEELHAVAHDLNLTGVVDIPITARELIPFLEEASPSMDEDLPDTAQSPAQDNQDTTNYVIASDDADTPVAEADSQAEDELLLDDEDDSFQESQSMEFVISEDGEKVEFVTDVPPPTKNIADETFQKLAAEEPPMPNFEDSGTVRDLVVGMMDTDVSGLLDSWTDDDGDTEPSPAIEFDEVETQDDGFIPAALILETALDNTTPIEAFSLEELFDNIREQLPPDKQGIEPLPSWVLESEQYTREPDFLPDELPVSEYTSSTTQPSDMDMLESDPGSLTTDRISPEVRSQPLEDELDLLVEDDYESDETPVSSSVVDEPVIEEDEPDTIAGVSPSQIGWQLMEGDEDYSDVDTDVHDYDDALPVEEETDANAYIAREAVELDEDVAPVIKKDSSESSDDDEPDFIPFEDEATDEVPVVDEADYADDLDEVIEEPIADEWDEIEDVVDEAVEQAESYQTEVADEPEEDYINDEPELEIEDDVPVIDDVAEGELVSEFDDAPVIDDLIEDAFEPEAEFEDDAPAIEDAIDDDVEPVSEYEDEAPLVEDVIDDGEEIIDEPVQSDEEAYIAQLALTLTQVSLELSAEATLLTQDNVIVAQAGAMPDEDIQDIEMAIEGDWDAKDDQSRIRFLTLPASGKDYMLFSKRTAGGEFTLSMVFSGTQQLRLIRQQGKRLSQALSAVPEDGELIADSSVSGAGAIIDDSSVIDPGPLAPYTFVWIVQDANKQLSDAVVTAILADLANWLKQLGWQIEVLDGEGDYLYLQADAPESERPSALIRKLMVRSADVASSIDDRLQADSLWADGYLVLKPGRAMSDEEIQEFIAFNRY